MFYALLSTGAMEMAALQFYAVGVSHDYAHIILMLLLYTLFYWNKGTMPYVLLRILTAFHMAVFGIYIGFAPDLHGGSVFRELKYHNLAPI